jgi:hypothetical protein
MKILIKEYENYMRINKINVRTFILSQFKNIQLLSNILMSNTKLPTLYTILLMHSVVVDMIKTRKN